MKDLKLHLCSVNEIDFAAIDEVAMAVDEHLDELVLATNKSAKTE